MMNPLECCPAVDESFTAYLAHGRGLDNFHGNQSFHALEVHVKLLKVPHRTLGAYSVRRILVVPESVEELVEVGFGR